MSPPPRGPRGGRAPRNRGSGRGRGGGNNGRINVNGNESDGESSIRGGAQRGRGRGDNNQNGNRSISQAFQQATRGQNAPRGSRGPRGGLSRGNPRGGLGNAGIKRSNEMPDQRYNRLKASREQERKDAIAQGFLADPDKPMNLADAVTMVGTCQEMCSEFERARRIYQKDVWGPEMVTTVNENGETKRETDESKMVKKFQRSAAGMDEQLPSDLRPPQVLLKTANYLFNDLLVDDESLVTANTFIWDRTRAIRNDFSIQQLTRIPDIRLAIECYEKIARYHILSLHQIGGKPQERAGDSYNWQQDREQLDKTLLSLLTYYENVKDRYRSKNEAEFRAYWILFQIGNSTAAVEDKVQTWPLDLLKHPRIQKALDLYAAASDVIDYKGPLRPPTPLPVAQQDWQKFWKLVASKQVSYLMSCVAEIGFNVVRRVILTTISMAYYPGGRKEIQDWTIEKMTEVLGFDDEETTRNFIEQSNLMIGEADSGAEYFKITSVRSLGGLPEPTAELPKQVHSWHLVERKRFGRTFPAVISGMPFKEAKEQGMIVPNWDEEVQAHSGVEEGLFVEDDMDTSVKPPPNPLLNPSVASFTPTATPSFAQSPFGQPSGLGNSPFGQPSAQSPFGQPSNSVATPQAAPAATPLGSFAAPPNSFMNLTGVITTPSQPAATTATTVPASMLSNPFAANPFTNSGTPANAPRPATTLFPKTSASPNPFAQSGSGSMLQASPFAPPVTPQALTVPAVQITPPDDEITSKKSEETAPKKPAFEFPTNGFKLPQNTPQDKSTPSSSHPLGFAGASSSHSTFKPAENILPDTSTTPLQSPFNFQKPPLSTSLPTVPTSQSIPTVTQPLQSPFSSFDFKKPTPATSSSISSPVSAPNANHFTAFQLLKTPPLQATQQSPLPVSTTPVATPAPPSRQTPSWEETRTSHALDFIAEQLVIDGKRGFFKQYISNIARDMVVQEMKKEERRRDNQDADDFRRFVLEFRYAALWKKNAQILKSRRKRKEMKRRLAETKEKNKRKSQDMDVSMRSSRPLSLEEDLAAFKAEREAQRKAKQEADEKEVERARVRRKEEDHRRSAQTPTMNSFDLIGQRPQQSEVMPPPASRNIRKEAQEPPSATAAAVRGHKRSKTQPETVLAPDNSRFRISKHSKEASPTPSLSSQSSLSLVNGGSLLDHHGLPYGTKVSTMKSPYFRLKAAGFGPTWNQDFSTSYRGVKRSRMSGDDILSNGSVYGDDAPSTQTHKRLRSPMDLTSFSSPTRPATASRTEGVDLGDSAKSSADENDGWKRSAEDEALLARARKMREMLEEGESWYKDEIAKDEFRRSQELRRSQLGTSRASSLAGSPPSGVLSSGPQDPSLPKFYSRVSKFLPREEYGIRREKKKFEEEAPKTNGKGKAMVNGTGSSGRRAMPPPPTPPKKSGSSWDDAIEL